MRENAGVLGSRSGSCRAVTRCEPPNMPAFFIHMKLTAETRYGHDEWNTDANADRIIRRWARRFSITPRQFLAKLSARQLPAQPNITGAKAFNEQTRMPQGFAVTLGGQRRLWTRIERAAEADGLSVREFAWQALAGWVNASEEVMLVDPNTRRALGSVLEIERCRSRHVRGFPELHDGYVTQRVDLDQKQITALQEHAHRRGCDLSQIVREAVDELIVERLQSLDADKQ
jgi:hypothetical protein